MDNDLWGHLFFGREILQGGQLPTHNLYSYTAPDYRWINHEWLAEIIFYWPYQAFGSTGLILLKVALGAGVVWMLDRIVRERVSSPFVRAVTLVWTMAILSPGFNVRPQIFTYLFFSILLFFFYRYENRRTRILYWVPLLIVVWVNLHGGFVAGLGAFVLFTVWTTIAAGRDGKGAGLNKTTIFIPVVLSLFSLVLNPFGLDLLPFLWKDLLLNRPITEWQPIFFLDFSFFEFKLAALFVLLFSLRGENLRRWDFILAVLAALLAFRYQRHTPLFGIVAAPFLAQAVQQVYLWIQTRVREWLLVMLLLAGCFYQIIWIGRIHLEHRFQIVVNPLDYPTQAADFLLQNRIQGNMAVPFDWGEYFIWKFYPSVRVSIDGRYTTAYPVEVIEDHWDWMEGKKGWRRLLERYPTEIAITNRKHPVTALLRKDPQWVYIYSDPVAFIFVRNTASNEQLLTRFREKQLLLPQPPSIYFPG